MGVRAKLALAATTGTIVLAGAGGASAATCHAGVHPYGSGQARTFCGNASAKVSVPGVTATIKGGNCQKTSKYFTINIGTVVLSGNPPKRPDYFGITVGQTPLGGKPAGHDGTYTGGAVSFVTKNKRYALINAVVTLTGNRTKGSFSGMLFGGGAASGTFSC